MKEQFSRLSPTLKKWLKIFFVVCILVTLSDLLLHHEGDYLWNFFGFYSLYGFFSCFILVILAKKMRFFLMRKEDYYDD